MKKIIVIGAGISGLSAAIYSQRSGFDVTLIEQHSIVGGMCTSWKRKGYLFEGAIHWLTGSYPKNNFYQLWKETGALNESIKLHFPDPFFAIEWKDQNIYLYRDIEKTANMLRHISPNDEKAIRRLVSDVKAFANIQMPITDIKGVKAENPKRMTLSSVFKMIPAFPKMGKLSNISNRKYIEQFKHGGIRRLLLNMIPENYSAVSLISTLATLNTGDGAYPEGGSLALAERMGKTFENLGGKLLLNTKVKKVNIEDKSVKSILTENDNIITADAVIVTQETIAAVKNLFNVHLNEKWLIELCNKTESAVCTFIGIGIKKEFSGHTLPVWTLKEPIKYAGLTISEIGFWNYSESKYKGYAPKSSSALTTFLMGDTYDFWEKAREQGIYEQEKQALAEQITRALCQKYPELQDNIDVIDIATPLTYERYTGAYHGSWMSGMSVGEKMKFYPGFLKEVSGLYFAGHRLMQPGGLPVALNTGRNAAQMVCRQFNVVFKC